MNTFKFVGQIKRVDDKGDRRNIETKKFESGWIIKRAKFRVVSGEVSNFVEASGSKWDDDSRNLVYTLVEKEHGNPKAGVEKAQIKWSERLNKEVVERVPNYKKYTVDLASDKMREQLVKDGKEDEAKALEAKKFTYISPYDFVSKIETLLESDAFGDNNYVITGTVEWNYSANKDGIYNYYRRFVPTNIYLATQGEEVGCTGKIDFYYNPKEYMGPELDNGDIPMAGYMQYYDSTAKGNYFVPIGIHLKGGYEKNSGIKHYLAKETEDCEGAKVVVLGLKVEFYNGAPKRDITMSDLKDSEREYIEQGLRTLEDIKRERGYGSAREDFKECIYALNVAQGYSAPQNPGVEPDRLLEKPIPKGKNADKAPVSNAMKMAAMDLFDDDCDLTI